MSRRALCRSRVLIPTILFAVILIGLGVFLIRPQWFGRNRPTALPSPGSPLYVKYAEAFNIGVGALDPLGGVPFDPEDEIIKTKEGLWSNLAYRKLTLAIETIPDEPAAWANRGLWYLRRNELEAAAQDLQRAEQLAPGSPEIQTLLALVDRQRGKFSEAESHFRKSLEKYPDDFQTLYALAMTIELQQREGGERDALQFIDDALKIRPYNYPLLRDKARTAIRLADRQTLAEVMAVYRQLAPDWTGEIAETTRAQLEVLDKESKVPLSSETTTTLMVLDNFLMAEPGYERDRDEVDPRDEFVGKPIKQFLRLKPMRSVASPPDLNLAFESVGLPGKALNVVGGRKWDVTHPVWLSRDAKPTVFVADAQEVQQLSAGGPVLVFPSGPKAVPPSVDGVLPVDLDNDFRTDLLLAGAGGLRFFLQDGEGNFNDGTAQTGLDPAILNTDYYGAWAAEVMASGDLDLIVAPRVGAPIVLRNNRDGTFNVLKPFAEIDGVRAFAWADLDHDGSPDAAFLDGKGKLHVLVNKNHGQFRERPLPDDFGKYVALTVGDVGGGAFDLIALRDDGVVQRIASANKSKDWQVTELARWPEFPAGMKPGAFRLFLADLDNNGALDLIASGPQGTRIWLGGERGEFSPLSMAGTPNVFATVALAQEGRLDLLGLSDSGQPVLHANRGKSTYHWQDIRVRAVAVGEPGKVALERNRVNSFGISSEVEIRAGLWLQKQIITSPVLHVGLGANAGTAITRIHWPYGRFQGELNLPADRGLEIRQLDPW